MIAAVDAVNIGHDPAATQVAHGHQIEQAVVEQGLRADLHAATEETPVSNRCQEHGHAPFRLVVQREHDVGVVVADQRADGGREKGCAAAQPL